MKKLIHSLILAALITACDQEPSDVLVNIPTPLLARFEAEVTSDSVVQFTNLSVGAESYIWNFGDGQTSLETEPVHHFNNGFYTVTLDAIRGEEKNSFVRSFDIITEEFVFVPPPVDTFKIIQTKWEHLTGGEGASKTWVLADEDDVIHFGPLQDFNTIWWGLDANGRAARTCLMNNEFTFSYDSSYVRETNGAIWKEFNMFSSEGCMSDGAYEQTSKGTEVSSWGDGAFDFRMSITSDSTLIHAHGLGAYIGHYVMGIDDSSFEPGMEYVYLIKNITETRLELQAMGFAGDSPISGYTEDQADRYWKVVLEPKN